MKSALKNQHSVGNTLHSSAGPVRLLQNKFSELLKDHSLYQKYLMMTAGKDTLPSESLELAFMGSLRQRLVRISTALSMG